MWEARKQRAEYARTVSVLRKDIMQINAEKAHLAAERVELIRHIDRLEREADEARQKFARMIRELKSGAGE